MLDAVTLDRDQLPYFNVLRSCDMTLSKATRFTDAWVAGIDAIVLGEWNRGTGVSAPDDLDIAGCACTTRCWQQGKQRTKASPRTLAISY